MIKDILYGTGMTIVMMVYPFVALPIGLGIWGYQKWTGRKG